MIFPSRTTLRPLALLTVAAVAVVAVERGTHSARQPLAPTYDALLVALAAWVLLACAAWGLLICAALVVETWSAGRVRALSWVATPPALRRALLAGVGVVLVGATPGPVGATVLATTTHEPQTLPLPARPLGEPAGPADRVLVVRPGDTLWALAARQLPPYAGDARVASAVRRWHAANRAVIGPDPDLIHPGQRLHAPRPDHDRPEH